MLHPQAKRKKELEDVKIMEENLRKNKELEKERKLQVNDNYFIFSFMLFQTLFNVSADPLILHDNRTLSFLNFI